MGNKTPPPCFIIAEAGVNHNGSIELAHRLVDAAVTAGADAIKFQTFRADKLASRFAPKANYQMNQNNSNQSQLEMLRGLELSEASHLDLQQHCLEAGIEFLSSPFDSESLSFLVSIGVEKIKLGSGELTNAPLLLEAARTGLPLILSTGMSTLSEVEAALGVVAYGCDPNLNSPSRAAFNEAWSNSYLRREALQRLTLLHCTTEYPTPFDQINLRAMNTIRQAFGVSCGYSDHTVGFEASLAAVALGASIIEKHFTLDRSLPGPDHSASLEPQELSSLVKSIRVVESALGDGVKVPMPVEMPNMIVARKSLVATRFIAKGEAISADGIAVKRPGSGLSPFDYWDTIGTESPDDFLQDQVIHQVKNYQKTS